MNDYRRSWLWFAAALSFIVGFILVMNNSAAGWVFFILGLVYIGTLTRTGQELAASNTSIRWGLIILTIVLVLFIIVVGGFFLSLALSWNAPT